MKKIFLIILSLAIVIFSGCEKQKLHKIYGDYILITYEVNGIDSLPSYRDSLSTHYSFFYDDVAYKNVCYIIGDVSDGSYSELYWSWKFADGYKNIEIYKSVGDIGVGPFGKDKFPIWEIKLGINHIEMKTNFNDKEHYIYLDKL